MLQSHSEAQVKALRHCSPPKNCSVYCLHKGTVRPHKVHRALRCIVASLLGQVKHIPVLTTLPPSAWSFHLFYLDIMAWQATLPTYHVAMSLSRSCVLHILQMLVELRYFLNMEHFMTTGINRGHEQTQMNRSKQCGKGSRLTPGCQLSIQEWKATKSMSGEEWSATASWPVEGTQLTQPAAATATDYRAVTTG